MNSPTKISQTILVLNPKGGSGKTTVSTNLASMFAARGNITAIMDYDPQGSSMQWADQRDEKRPILFPVNACNKKTGQTRTFQLKLPDAVDRIVIDAPAGASGIVLQEILERSDIMLIPVAPSPIDIHATADFIRDLMVGSKIRNRMKDGSLYIGIIANRVRSGTAVYEPLKKFIRNLSIPLVTTLTDTDNYIHAASTGIGIHDMDDETVHLERQQWRPLVQWLDNPSHQAPKKPVQTKGMANKTSAQIIPPKTTTTTTENDEANKRLG